MPAVSKAQRRLFAACEHGADYASCPQMSHQKMREWATTSEQGLPERKAQRSGQRKISHRRMK